MLYRSLLVSSVNSVIGGVIRSSKDFVALRKPTHAWHLGVTKLRYFQALEEEQISGTIRHRGGLSYSCVS
jgi:hypothetical protein